MTLLLQQQELAFNNAALQFLKISVPKAGTVLPRLVRMRTIKLTSFFDEKTSLFFSNFIV